MSAFATIKDFARSLELKARVDPCSGHLYYPVGGRRVYIRHRAECVRKRYRDHAFRNIYFQQYLPQDDDCVVDVGAGLGTEIVDLANHSPTCDILRSRFSLGFSSACA